MVWLSCVRVALLQLPSRIPDASMMSSLAPSTTVPLTRTLLSDARDAWNEFHSCPTVGSPIDTCVVACTCARRAGSSWARVREAVCWYPQPARLSARAQPSNETTRRGVRIAGSSGGVQGADTVTGSCTDAEVSESFLSPACSGGQSLRRDDLVGRRSSERRDGIPLGEREVDGRRPGGLKLEQVRRAVRADPHLELVGRGDPLGDEVGGRPVEIHLVD